MRQLPCETLFIGVIIGTRLETTPYGTDQPRSQISRNLSDCLSCSLCHVKHVAKAEIKIAANEALRNSCDWNTFAVLLARKNIHIIPKYRRGTQDMQGISFQMGDYKVKGSDVGEAFKYKSLERP